MSRECDICGTEFKPKTRNHRRCSRECTKEHKRRYDERLGIVLSAREQEIFEHLKVLAALGRNEMESLGVGAG